MGHAKTLHETSCTSAEKYPSGGAECELKQTIFQKGVQQLTSRTITSSEIPSRLAVNLPANVANIGDIMGLGLQFGLFANQYITELDFRLQIGEAQGQARTVARPNIQVSDGKKRSYQKWFSIKRSRPLLRNGEPMRNWWKYALNSR